MWAYKGLLYNVINVQMFHKPMKHKIVTAVFFFWFYLNILYFSKHFELYKYPGFESWDCYQTEPELTSRITSK